MKKFIFDGVEYPTESLVRKAIWSRDRKAFGVPKSAEEWQKLGVTFSDEVLELTEEQMASRQLFDSKRKRKVAIANLVVEVDGLLFDGNETSQERIARRVATMNDGDVVSWVLANDVVAKVSKVQLEQALRLAVEKQSELWVAPYEG